MTKIDKTILAPVAKNIQYMLGHQSQPFMCLRSKNLSENVKNGAAILNSKLADIEIFYCHHQLCIKL